MDHLELNGNTLGKGEGRRGKKRGRRRMQRIEPAFSFSVAFIVAAAFVAAVEASNNDSQVSSDLPAPAVSSGPGGTETKPKFAAYLDLKSLAAVVYRRSNAAGPVSRRTVTVISASLLL